MRIGAFSSFPCHSSAFQDYTPYGFTEFPWLTSIYLAFPHFLSACSQFPPSHCCFKTLLFKVSALWFSFLLPGEHAFYLMLFTHLGPFPPHASQMRSPFLVECLIYTNVSWCHNPQKIKVGALPCQMCSMARKRKPLSSGSPDLALSRLVRWVLVNGHLVEFVHLVWGIKRSFELWTGRAGAH